MYTVGECSQFRIKPVGRAAWPSSCSPNAHDKNVLAWDKSASRRVRGRAGENVARNRGSTGVLFNGSTEGIEKDASREERSLLACCSLARGNGASMGKETVSANSERAGEVVADEMFTYG